MATETADSERYVVWSLKVPATFQDAFSLPRTASPPLVIGFASYYKQGRESRCLCRIRLKFDSVAKLPTCPDHSDRAHSFGLFAHRQPGSFLCFVL